jgi:hypothetical protein
MSVLKFECPGCGQHMECNRACAGDIIHCPRCTAELRIPLGETPGAMLRAELILHAGQACMPAGSPEQQHAPEPVEALCPVCESHLRVSVDENDNTGARPALAQLVRKGQKLETASIKETANEKNSDHADDAPKPDLAHMTMEERERQIAKAREAHPIQISAPVKPRLSYILSGEAPEPKKAA